MLRRAMKHSLYQMMRQIRAQRKLKKINIKLILFYLVKKMRVISFQTKIIKMPTNRRIMNNKTKMIKNKKNKEKIKFKNKKINIKNSRNRRKRSLLYLNRPNIKMILIKFEDYTYIY